MSKEVEEAINAVENDIYDLKGFLTESEKIKWQKSLETVLNYIKLIEEERDGIYADYQDLGKAYYDSIPKQVIRDKIEELKKERQKIESSPYDKWDLYKVIGKIEVLDELLESE